MTLAGLSLDQWRSFDLPTARRVAREAADLVGGRVAAQGLATPGRPRFPDGQDRPVP
ncbi:hypothetical protein ACFC1R_37405 [Kitasatospora sp. NPDC056138]|uniref:hypothetical protein n=1 Tax=Kitasatospora sp. NPDC056138 TaxID=3345724 RepID=UPI0035D62D90